jgi:hypothetical protein
MYIDYDKRGQMLQVRCKGACGVVLVTMGWKPTAEYGELVISLREPDGMLSKHETAMCAGCRRRLICGGARPGELEAIYAEDVEQYIDTAIRYKLSATQAYQMGERQALRTPLRVLNELSRPEAAAQAV